MKKLISITAVVCCLFTVGCSDDTPQNEIDVSAIPTFTEKQYVPAQEVKTPKEIAIETRAKERQEALIKKLKDERERVRSEAMYPIREGAI